MWFCNSDSCSFLTLILLTMSLLENNLAFAKPIMVHFGTSGGPIVPRLPKSQPLSPSFVEMEASARMSHEPAPVNEFVDDIPNPSTYRPLSSVKSSSRKSHAKPAKYAPHAITSVPDHNIPQRFPYLLILNMGSKDSRGGKYNVPEIGIVWRDGVRLYVPLVMATDDFDEGSNSIEDTNLNTRYLYKMLDHTL